MRAHRFAVFAVVVVLGVGASAPAAVTTPVNISGPSPFAPGCNGISSAVGSEVEVSAAVNPTDPANAIVTWQQDRIPDGGARGIAGAYTRDGGATWTRFVVPGLSVCSGGTARRATDPWVVFGADGTAHHAALSYDSSSDEGAVVVSRSEDGGATWSPPVVVASDTGLVFNDKEALTADPEDPDRLYLVWAKIAQVAIVTVVSQSLDGGRTWTPPVPIHGPVGSLGGQGNQVAALGGGRLVNIYTELTPSAYMIKSMVSVGGLTWSPGVPIARISGDEGPSTPVPVRAGGWIPAVGAGDGAVVVSWADGNRILFSRSTDGVVWSAPAAVKGGGAPRFTPEVAIAPDGTIGISYYDFRNDVPGGIVSTDAWFSSSADDGATWTEQHLHGPFDIRHAPFSPGRGYFLGDYEGLDASSAGFVAAFAASNPAGDGTDVYATSITV